MQNRDTFQLPDGLTMDRMHTLTTARAGIPFMTLAQAHDGSWYAFNRKNNYAHLDMEMTLFAGHILVTDANFRVGYKPLNEADLKCMAIVASDILNADDLAYSDVPIVAAAPCRGMVDIAGLHFDLV